MKRTRPRSATERPDRTVKVLPLNAPFPGCCKPYPDARFVETELVELYAHHNGSQCKGYMERMSLEDWYDEIGAVAASRSGGGDDR